MINLNLYFNNNKKTIKISNDFTYNLDKLKCKIAYEFGISKPSNIFMIVDNHKSFENASKLLSLKENYRIDIFNKKRGGIITTVVNLLYGIVKMCKQLGIFMYEFFRLLLLFFEMIPLIFDPPKLIDDIIFAVGYSINTMISKMGTSGNTTKTDDSVDKESSGPFGVSKRERNPICIQPTIASLIMLILCPPLAIFYKYSFARGFIPAIVCGVLCVKLYYFPGLLFAALMVLC